MVRMSATHEKTRQERTAEAKRQAAALERRRRTRIIGATVIAVAVLIGLAIVGIRHASKSADDSSVSGLGAVSGVGAAVAPPWPLPTDTLLRVRAAGMDLGPMGTAEHYHAHLDITVDEKPVAVPTDIGVDAATGAMAPLHTHTADGVIHVESDRKGRPFTLGQLFTAWNVRLTVGQMGSLVVDEGTTLTAFVDGKKVDGNPAMIQLAEHQQISLVYGLSGAKVDVRDTFDFGGV